MKLFSLTILLTAALLASCNFQKEPEIRKDDFHAIDIKYHEKLKQIFLDGSDSSFKKIKLLEPKLRELIFAYKQTRSGDAAFLESDSQKIQYLSQSNKSEPEIDFYKKVLEMRKEYPVFFTGTSKIIESLDNNILAFTNTDKKDTLLSVLNFDTRNHLFSYSGILTHRPLLDNYADLDITLKSDSILLKPFQVKIYKIK
jgi:hypothetical protein